MGVKAEGKEAVVSTCGAWVRVVFIMKVINVV